MTSGAGLHLNGDMTDAPDDVVRKGPALLDRYDRYRVRLIVRTEHQILFGKLHVLHCSAAIVAHSIHVRFLLAIRFQRVVMAVNEDGGARQKTWVHAHAIMSVYFDEHEAVPAVSP